MHPWGTAGRMDLFHQVKESMSQLDSAPGAGQLEPAPGEGRWDVSVESTGFLLWILITHFSCTRNGSAFAHPAFSSWSEDWTSH